MNLTELISRGGECAYARYAAPSVERVDISVERGFAQSGDFNDLENGTDFGDLDD